MVANIFFLLSGLLIPCDETVTLEKGRTSYLLVFGSVVEGSVALEGYEGAWRVSGDSLYIEPAPDEEIEITLSYITMTIPEIVRHHEPSYESAFPVPDSTRNPFVSRTPPTNSSGQQLDVHGAKTFSLSIDDGGTTDLDQGLTIKAAGDIAGVEVDAHVTDEEASFVPEGTTKEIQDFDRIFVGLSRNNWEIELGDLDFTHPLFGYGSIDRRLAGLKADAAWNKIRALGAFGIDATRRRHQQLDIEDGKMGPYFIGDYLSSQPPVPGSEKVYLDGRLLERGINADYTIDYFTGELTFNNSSRVDASSRVEIYYTYSSSDYRSDNQLASIEAGPLGIVFYREASSLHHLYHSWSTEQQGILDTASGTEVILPGASMVGENRGSYVLEDGHYTWAGYAGGDYDVVFRYTGEGGDYVLEPDSGFFRYVGPDSGDYRAEIDVCLPPRHEAAAISLEEDFGDFSFELAGLGSRTTPNLYNDGNQFFGHAHRANLGYSTDRLNTLIWHRLQTADAWIPADGTYTDTRDLWNLDSLPEEFAEQGAQITWEPWDSFYTSIGAGHLWRSESDIRAGFFVNSSWLSLSADWLAERQRVNASVRPGIGKFTPRAGISFEHYTQDVRSIQPEAGLTYYPADGISLGVQASRRIDQNKLNGWQDTLYFDRIGSSLDWQASRISASAAAGIEILTPFDTTSGWQAVYGIVNTSWNPTSRIRLTANYDQHLSADRVYVVEYRPTEPGTGDYTRDPETGEYVPASDGDYELITRFEEGAALEVERRGNLGADVNLKSLRFWSALAYRDGSDTRLVSATARVTMFPHLKEISVIISPKYIWQKLPIWGGSQEGLRDWGSEVELRSRIIPGYVLRLLGFYTNEERTRDLAELRSREEWSVELAPIIDAWLKLEPVLGFGTLAAQEPYYYPELDQIDIQKVWAGTGAEKRLGDWRLSAGVLLTARQSNVDIETLPYLITRDDPAGFHPSWTAGLQRTFGTGLSLKAAYEGNLYPDDRGLTSEFELSAGMYF